MDVAGARRGVEDKIIQVAPIRVGNQLLERVRGHAAAPQRGSVGIDKETDGQDAHTVLFGGNEELPAVPDFGKDTLRFEVEHLRNGRTEDIGIEEAGPVALGRQCHGQVGRYGALAHTALARTHGDDVLHAGQHFPGLGTGCLKRLGMDFHHCIAVGIGMDGCLGRLEYGFHKGVGGFFKDEGEGHVHPIDAQVVLHHTGFHQVLSRAGVAHSGQGIGDKFGVESSHNDIAVSFSCRQM